MGRNSLKIPLSTLIILSVATIAVAKGPEIGSVILDVTYVAPDSENDYLLYNESVENTPQESETKPYNNPYCKYPEPAPKEKLPYKALDWDGPQPQDPFSIVQH